MTDKLELYTCVHGRKVLIISATSFEKATYMAADKIIVHHSTLKVAGPFTLDESGF